VASHLSESAESPETHIVTVEKEMGYSLPEFLSQFCLFTRYLPVIFKQKMNLTIQDDLIRVLPERHLNNASELRIELSVLPNRCLGALVLPRLQVCFYFIHFSELTKIEFFKQFDRSFQKGGG